jgi:putative transposase
LATTGEKRRFVDHHRGQFGSVSAACEAAGIPVSTYYYKGEEDSMTQAAADAKLRDRIETVQAEFPFYGYRRVHEHLERHEGLTVNKKRLQRVMKEHGLRALIWRGFKVKTTDSDHEHGFAPNLLPGLTVDGPNQVWVADITYIRILTGFVYLAVVMDLFQRKVVGWALSQRINHKLCIAALEKAVTERRPAPGCIHHSDRGWQYACPDYRRYLLDHEIAASMSAKGYCYDNAFMESFFKTLKAEEVYLTEYETYEDVLDAVPTFIDEVYNTKRMHSSLGYLAPDEYEKLWSSGELKKLGINPCLKLKGDLSN